jgi:hypothetical protein
MPLDLLRTAGAEDQKDFGIDDTHARRRITYDPDIDLANG